MKRSPRVTTMFIRLARVVLLLAAALIAVPGISAFSARQSSSEDEIRRLEQDEVRAIMERDDATLRRLWDGAYVVNSPDNVVVEAKADPTDRPVMQKGANVNDPQSRKNHLSRRFRVLHGERNYRARRRPATSRTDGEATLYQHLDEAIRWMEACGAARQCCLPLSRMTRVTVSFALHG
jgi:hypothetical protein